MTEERLKDLLMEIYAEANDENADDILITDNTDIIEDLGFDSIMYLKLLVAIEEETGIELDDEDSSDIAVFSSLYRKVRQ